MKLLLLLFVILIAACAPTVPQSITAKQNLNAAQVQVTNAALNEQAAEQATATVQARRNADIASATEQAVNATRIANDATVQAISIEQQGNAATAQAEQNKSAVAISINMATATAQAIDRQARIEIDNATRTAAEAHATSTAIARAAVEDSKTSFAAQDAEFTFWVGWAIKIGLCIIGFIGILVIIEAIRKRASVMHVGNYTVAVDGGAVGSMEAYLLMPESKPLMIAAPPPDAIVQGGNGTHAQRINGNTVESMSQDEFEERQYWRTRTMRFLQAAMQATSPGSNRIPRYDRLGVKAADWVETTDALGQWIDKQERQPTFCLPPYETLMKLYEAIEAKHIAPLPPFLRAKYGGNSGKQETGEQRKTGETGAKTAGNRAVSLPDDNDPVWALPGVSR